MQFTSFTKTDSYYEFTGCGGEFVVIPSDKIILVDDESGLYSIKLIGSRQTIGTVPTITL